MVPREAVFPDMLTLVILDPFLAAAGAAFSTRVKRLSLQHLHRLLELLFLSLYLHFAVGELLRLIIRTFVSGLAATRSLRAA